jgi:hypothetical protein
VNRELKATEVMATEAMATRLHGENEHTCEHVLLQQRKSLLLN